MRVHSCKGAERADAREGALPQTPEFKGKLKGKETRNDGVDAFFAADWLSPFLRGAMLAQRP